MKTALTEEFMTSLKIGEQSKTGYLYDLGSFYDFISSRFKKDSFSSSAKEARFISTLSAADMYAYVNYLKMTRNLSDRTVARKISSLKKFLRFIDLKYCQVSNEVINFSFRYDNTGFDNEVLSNAQIKDLINYVNNYESDRNKIVIFLMLFNGITVKELVGIKNGDVLKKSIVINSGTENQRIIKINDALRAILSRFKIADDQLYLINGPSNGQISPRRIQAIVKKALRAIGIDRKGISTGILRNTSVRMIREYNSADFADVKNFLGITTDAQVEKYFRKSEETDYVDMNRNPFSKF